MKLEKKTKRFPQVIELPIKSEKKFFLGGKVVLYGFMMLIIESCSGCNQSSARNKSSEANIVQMLAFSTQLQSEKNVFLSSPIKTYHLAQLALLSIFMSCKRCSVFCQQLKQTKQSGRTSMFLLLSANVIEIEIEVCFFS